MADQDGQAMTRMQRLLLTWRAAALMAWVEWRTRQLGLGAMQRRLGADAPPKKRRQPPPAEQIAEIVAHANRRFSLYRSDCVVRSLVLQSLLRQYGHEAELEVGARKLSGQFEAHAWVEIDGQPLCEPDDVRRIYTPFDWKSARGDRLQP